MSGHSKWKTIKHKKEASDQKRGQVFSKLLAAISAAARTEANPEFNPRLRTAVQKAREAKVPNENIERAISRAKEAGAVEELLIEAFGPAGSAILIEATTANKNRTIAEIKKILNENSAKWAEPGNVRWSFDQTADGWQPKFKQELAGEDKSRLSVLIEALKNHNDVQEIYSNAE